MFFWHKRHVKSANLATHIDITAMSVQGSLCLLTSSRKQTESASHLTLVTVLTWQVGSLCNISQKTDIFSTLWFLKKGLSGACPVTSYELTTHELWRRHISYNHLLPKLPFFILSCVLLRQNTCSVCCFGIQYLQWFSHFLFAARFYWENLVSKRI